MRAKLSELSARLASGVRSSIQDEATTITALVLPFLSALGYDVTNPDEYRREYPCDFRKQGACADAAVMRNGEPIFLIECKKHTIPLTEMHAGQLRAYFSVHSSAKLGILTNGAEYRFYTDSEKPNIMDSEPFLAFDLSRPDSIPYNALKLFSHSNYTEKVFSRLSAVNRIKKDILKELKHQNGELARLIFAQIDFSLPEPAQPANTFDLAGQALSLVRLMLSEIVAPDRIVIHSAMPHWCSLAIDGLGNVIEVQLNHKTGKKWILMNILDGVKHPISDLADIAQYSDRICASAKKVLAKQK